MYTTKQQKTSVSRIQPTSKSQQTLMRQIDSSNTVLQRKLLQYHNGDINTMLNMDVCFTTQGIDCKFIDGKKNGANWISETEVLRIPSHSISGNVMNYATMACHLNIKFKAGTINTNEKKKQIQIDTHSVHWTIRSIEDQRKIDRYKSATLDANDSFHKSSGSWNSGNKDKKTEEDTIKKIGINPNDTRLSKIDIETTKSDLSMALISACKEQDSDYTTECLYL